MKKEIISIKNLASRITLIGFVCSLFFSTPCISQTSRTTLSLNGAWEVEESVDSVIIPKKFTHLVEVPGLVNQSKPSFPKVDQFKTSDNRWDYPNLDGPTAFVDTGGVSFQDRNYFWYRKTFKPAEKRQLAMLKINKAQFGSTIWLNGKKVGQNLSCFSSKTYNLTPFIKWDKENVLLVRIGAHPNVLPKGVPYGMDFEKTLWTPGIYDEVSLSFCDNPFIEQVQIAPDIHTSKVVVQTKIINYGNSAAFTPAYEIKEWKSGITTSTAKGKSITLDQGKEVMITDTIQIPKAKLWSVNSPFLYTINISTSGDNFVQRFGMREFRFDTPTKRAYLNDTMIYLRGSNIGLHRFFEDPKCGSLPWDEKWVRKMLVEIPKSLDWNSFRFTIGPVPDKWFDIADEAGLLIQNEFFIWTLVRKDIPDYWNVDILFQFMKEWMADSWNHPCVVTWDAMNETRSEIIRKNNIVDRLRTFDLSDRPWESSYNPPSGANDPVEFHPYLLHKGFYHWNINESFNLVDLETLYPKVDALEFVSTGHAMILNEYGWLWLNRDGNPTIISKRQYDKLLGPNATAQQRREYYAYVVGGLTEYWRAYRMFAGIQYFVYLTSSFPEGITSDNFIDIEKLEMEPNFKDYIHEASKSVGVYLNFWQPTLQRKTSKRFTVMMINDNAKSVEGNIELTIENLNGQKILTQTQAFKLEKFGQDTYYIEIEVPDYEGDCLVSATAKYNNLSEKTVSRRKVKLEK
jgi:hypothetical protein